MNPSPSSDRRAALRASLPTVAPPALTPAQEKVQALIALQPGLTIRQVAVRLGVSHATTTYHLGVMVRKGLLLRQRDGREVRHFLNSGSGSTDQFVEALYRDARKRKVIEFLAAREVALSINKMALHLGLPFGYLKRTLQQLEAQGLVALPSVCMRYYVEVRPQLRSLVATFNPEPTLQDREPALRDEADAAKDAPSALLRA